MQCWFPSCPSSQDVYSAAPRGVVPAAGRGAERSEYPSDAISATGAARSAAVVVEVLAAAEVVVPVVAAVESRASRWAEPRSAEVVVLVVVPVQPRAGRGGKPRGAV